MLVHVSFSIDDSGSMLLLLLLLDSVGTAGMLSFAMPISSSAPAPMALATARVVRGCMDIDKVMKT